MSDDIGAAGDGRHAARTDRVAAAAYLAARRCREGPGEYGPAKRARCFGQVTDKYVFLDDWRAALSDIIGGDERLTAVHIVTWSGPMLRKAIAHVCGLELREVKCQRVEWARLLLSRLLWPLERSAERQIKLVACANRIGINI